MAKAIETDTLLIVCAGRAPIKSAGGEVHHLMDPATKRTLCGRDASDWLRIDSANFESALASAFCCARCNSRIDA